MKRKFLEAMGLNAEQIDAIMTEHGNTLNPIRTARDDYEEKLEAEQNKVKALEKISGNSQAAQDEVQRLKDENAAWQTKFDNVKLDTQIKLAVAKEAHDPDDLLLFVKKEGLKLGEDGRTIEGLDAELTRLKESKGYLFAAPATPGTTPPADTPPADTPPPIDYTPPAGNSNQPKDTDLAELGKQDAARYAKPTT